VQKNIAFADHNGIGYWDVYTHYWTNVWNFLSVSATCHIRQLTPILPEKDLDKYYFRPPLKH